MTNATLQEDDLAWTPADDAAARELLDASCSSRHELRPRPPLPHLSHEVAPPRTPSVFNRDDDLCLNPRRVDPNTGEIILFCRSRQCSYCIKTQAIRYAFRIVEVAKRTELHEFTLTDIGETPEEWLPKRFKFTRSLKNRLGIEWTMAAEVAPETYRPHAHGFAKLSRPVTKAEFQEAATAAGLGRVEFQKVPDRRAGLAKHYAYISKSLDDPDPIVRSEFLKWNAYGSKVGFKQQSRGFFQKDDGLDSTDFQKDSSDESTNADDADEHTEAPAVDGSAPPVRPSHGLNDEAAPEVLPTPYRGFERSVFKFLVHPVRAFRMMAKSGLFARSRGP